MMMAVH